MKKVLIFSALAAVVSVALAQEQGRVLAATPIVQQIAVPQQVCGNETIYNGNRTSGAGAVLGAIAGGAAGNAIGGGSGRAAATAIGVLGGAVLGNQIEGGRPHYENVQRCQTETYYEDRTVGYDVVYEYAGRQYTTRTQDDPGNWIAVNVQPAAGSSYYHRNDDRGLYRQPGVVISTVPSPPVYRQPAYPPQPIYVQPPVTVIEYGYERGGRPYPPHHRGGYWR